MSDKDKVLSRYPHASAEQDKPGCWTVWDISHEERDRLDNKHFPKRFGRGLYGLGRSELESWADAVRRIEQQEGKKLPLSNVIQPPQ